MVREVIQIQAPEEHPEDIWENSPVDTAAWNGETETMLAANRDGCPWSQHTTGLAAQNGHTDTMLAAHREGCPWSEFTTAAAAFWRHVETMLAAVNAGCPWSRDTFIVAPFGSMDALRAAISYGCDKDSQNIVPAVLHFFAHNGALLRVLKSDSEEEDAHILSGGRP